MTYKVLMDDTKKIIHHLYLCHFDAKAPNWRSLPLGREDVTPTIKSKFENVTDNVGDISKSTHLPVVDPINIVHQTFLMKENDDGECFHACIMEALDDFHANIANNPENIKFRCSVNDGQYEEILSLHQIIDHIDDDIDNVIIRKF